MKLRGCHALITGASAGIGREFAQQLAPHAQSLLLVARRQDRLDSLRAELLALNPDLRVDLWAVDLSEGAQIDRLIERIDADKIAVDFLVNNAGLGDLGPFATAEPGRLEEMLAVNVVALTRLTRALLPAMIAQRRGAILNVSSSASFLPIANFAVYAATKAYVTSFTEAIRAETRAHGLTVTSLCPGPVHTEFTSVAYRADDQSATLGPAFLYVSVEKVVASALAAVAHDRALVIPGTAMKIGMTIVRILPLAFLRLAARFTAK